MLYIILLLPYSRHYLSNDMMGRYLSSSSRHDLLPPATLFNLLVFIFCFQWLLSPLLVMIKNPSIASIFIFLEDKYGILYTVNLFLLHFDSHPRTIEKITIFYSLSCYHLPNYVLGSPCIYPDLHPYVLMNI